MAITDFSINAGNGFVDLMLLDDADPSGISITDSYQLLLPPIRRIVSQPIYTFANEGVWPSGTVFRLVSGQTAVATADLQQRQLPAGAFARFGQTISAYAGAKLLHQRNIAASYAPWNFRIVRQRDGSAFFLVASDTAGHPANLPVGEFVLNLTVNRSLGAADPGNLRLWLRGNSTAATEVLNWRVRVPART
jgi:hypothetical protein